MPIIPTTIKNRDLVEKRRDQIIRAAIKLFAQKGFHKTTMRELADEAGISHGNMYEYVRNKEDIFFLLHNFMADLADASLSQCTRDVRDPLEKLRRMLRTEFNLMHHWADAILIIYRESYILSEPVLKRLLKREREHVAKFELVLQECVQKGLLRQVNNRILANLIKIMTDCWVLKRWDLREYVTPLEMERCILDVILKGMETGDRTELPVRDNQLLEGKSALVINGGTFLGKAIASFLVSRGVRLAVQGGGTTIKGIKSFFAPGSDENIRLFPAEQYGEMSGQLLRRIIQEFGPVDYVIHDTGIGHTEMKRTDRHRLGAAKRLEDNFSAAQDMALPLEEVMGARRWGRIIFIAPWAWDQYAEPLRYQTVKDATISLTRAMAKQLAPARVNVNCIVPGFISGHRPMDIQKNMGLEAVKKIALGHVGEISDVTESVYFLLSDASKYLTGHILNMNGGLDL